MFEQVEVNSERWFDMAPLLNEEFRDVKGFENLYQISNYGRVKSLERSYFIRKNVLKVVKERILVNSVETGGYFKNTLYKNKKHYQIKNHRLVAKAFIPNPLELPEVNHKDSNKKNNIVSNLEWCDKSYNITYAYKYGNKKMPIRLQEMIKNFDGENNPNSKLTKKDIVDIRNQISQNISCNIIAQKYNLHPSYVYLIKSRKIWKNI